MKPAHEQIKKLSDKLMKDAPVTAACLSQVAIIVKHGAEDALFKNLGEFTSQLIHGEQQVTKD